MNMQEDLALILRRSGKYVFTYDICADSAMEIVDAFRILGLPKQVDNFEQRLMNGGIVTAKSIETCRSFFDKLRCGKPEETVELRLRTAGGIERQYRFDSMTVFKNYKPIRAVISFYECSGRDEREYNRLVESAARDSMTGLLNHAAMEQRVETYLHIEPAVESRAMLMIDIDDFKQINDSCGHQAGDEVLVRTAGILRGCFRDGDLVGRMCGDEFRVFIPSGINERGINIKARELLAALSVSCDEPKITVSMGIALSTKKTCFCQMYAEADRALYDAKRSGKNTYCVSNHGCVQSDSPALV